MTKTALAAQFFELFAGSETSHGTYDLSNPIVEENKKIRGRAVTKHSAVTPQMWEAHLAGEGPGVGVVPIRNDSSCFFGAIDVDSYSGLDLSAIVRKLKSNKIPLVVCRSKSGGAHIYCFAKIAVSAANMKSKLSEVAGFLGFGMSEIFPKQTQILADRGDAGSWISVPYFNGTRGMRYAVDEDGNALSPEAFLLQADSFKVDPGFFTTLLVLNDEFADGPPCLQTLAQIGYPVGERNNGLYAIGVYLKKSHPDSWTNDLQEYNHKYLHPPLTVPEVEGLAKSLRKKDYFYGCTKQPIVSYCNATLCRTRKWGVGSGSTGKFPILGGLSKLDTRPPLWFWECEGKRLELQTEDLQDVRRFQRLVMANLNMMITLPAAPAWTAAVQQAMDNLTIIEAPEDSSPESQFFEFLEKFCTGRAQALTIDEIVLGKPFTDGGKTAFRMQDLESFLGRHKFFDFKRYKIASILKDSGAEHRFKNINGKGTNFWLVPAFATSTNGFHVPEELREKKEPF